MAWKDLASDIAEEFGLQQRWDPATTGATYSASAQKHAERMRLARKLDPAAYAAELAQQKVYKKRRLAEDPAAREAKRQRNREYKRRRRARDREARQRLTVPTIDIVCTAP